MKKYFYLIVSLTLLLIFSSCGKKKDETPEYVRPDIFEGYNESTLIFNADGSITEIAIQDYNESDVDYTGLKSYVESEINNANSKLGSDSIAMTDYFDDSGVIKAAIHYTDINSYNYFNSVSYDMSGFDPDKCDIRVPLDETVDASAGDATYTDAEVETELVEATFTDASDNSTKRSSEISKSYMMLMLDDKVDVKFDDGKVLYYNSYVEKGKSDNTVKSNGEGQAVIVFEFNYAY